MKDVHLHTGERIDDLQRGGCRLIQRSDLFSFGIDAVLLADFARVADGSTVLDLCCGGGIIPILMDARMESKTCHFTGIEINPDCVDLARRSAAMNGQSDRIRFIEGDIRKAGTLAAPALFDAVTANPPYMIGGHGLTGPNYAKTIAKHEVLLNLSDVVKAASRALKLHGSFFLVHRPYRLADIFRELNACSLEPKRMRMVEPYAGREPNIVLIEAVKGGRPRLKVEPTLVVYEREGVYTKELLDIYGKQPEA